MGGDSNGTVLSRSFILSWDASKKCAVETPLPDFPAPVQLGNAAVKDSCVYIAGASGTESLPSNVWMLDLDDLDAGWHPLPPLPGPKDRTLAQVFVQNGDQKRKYLYVIGGFAKHEDGGAQALTDGYAFDLSQSLESGTWNPISPAIPKGSNLPAWPFIGARCVTSGDQHVLFFGGLDSGYFDDNQRKMATLTGEVREQQRIAYQSTLPTTWNRDVLVYHTVTDRWFTLGELPFPATVGGSAIMRSDKSILLASGEIQPGIRTPLCIAGKFVAKKKFSPLNWAVMGLYFCVLAGWAGGSCGRKKVRTIISRGAAIFPGGLRVSASLRRCSAQFRSWPFPHWPICQTGVIGFALCLSC